MWRKSLYQSVTVKSSKSDRLVAIKIEYEDRSPLIFSVYMPTDSVESMIEYTDCLSEKIDICENRDMEKFLYSEILTRIQVSASRENC